MDMDNQPIQIKGELQSIHIIIIQMSKALIIVMLTLWRLFNQYCVVCVWRVGECETMNRFSVASDEQNENQFRSN